MQGLELLLRQVCKGPAVCYYCKGCVTKVRPKVVECPNDGLQFELESRLLLLVLLERPGRVGDDPVVAVDGLREDRAQAAGVVGVADGGVGGQGELLVRLGKGHDGFGEQGIAQRGEGQGCPGRQRPGLPGVVGGGEGGQVPCVSLEIGDELAEVAGQPQELLHPALGVGLGEVPDGGKLVLADGEAGAGDRVAQVLHAVGAERGLLRVDLEVVLAEAGEGEAEVLQVRGVVLGCREEVVQVPEDEGHACHDLFHELAEGGGRACETHGGDAPLPLS